jgi:hypothetical protein
LADEGTTVGGTEKLLKGDTEAEVEGKTETEVPTADAVKGEVAVSAAAEKEKKKKESVCGILALLYSIIFLCILHNEFSCIVTIVTIISKIK